MNKMSASRVNKGFELEKKYSAIVHRCGMPVLLSSLLLREIGAGQVDLAVMEYNRPVVYLYEIKSHGHLSYNQQKRLKSSSIFVGEILNCVVLWKLLAREPLYEIKDKKM